MSDNDNDLPDPVGELRLWRPHTAFPLLRKETVYSGDISRNLYPVCKLTFGYASGKTLPLRFATDVVKVIHGTTGKTKSYSPTSEPQCEGEFDLIVKVYPGEGHSAYLDSVVIGDYVQMMGPIPPRFMRPLVRPAARVIAIALGIGITHAFTTVRDILSMGGEEHVTLVVVVQYVEQDVVLLQDIAKLERVYAGRFQVVRCLTKERVNGWRYGRVDATMVKEIIEDTQLQEVRVMVVGTKSMIKAVWKELSDIGLTYEQHALVKKLSKLDMLRNLVMGSRAE